MLMQPRGSGDGAAENTSADPSTLDTRAEAGGQRLRNLGLAALLAPAGCLNVVIILVALFIGLWLDAQTGQRGPFTIGLVLMSIPISLFFMVRIALSTVRQLPPPQARESIRDQSRKREE